MKRLLPYVRPYTVRTIIALGLAIPIGCLDAVIAMALKPYMDVVMIEKQVKIEIFTIDNHPLLSCHKTKTIT